MMLIDFSNLQARAIDTTPIRHDIIPFSPSGLIIAIWVGTAIATFFTMLRTWLQFLHNKRLYSNDILICLAIVLHVVLSITVQCMVPVITETFSGSRDTADFSSLPGAQATKFLKYQFAVLCLIWTALWTVKLAMLSFFWRLFTSVKTNARVFWWIMCGITIVTWIASLLLQAFASSPPSKSFDMAAFISPKSIEGWNRAFFFSSCVDIVTDFMIMLVPFPLLWKLQMPRRQKNILIVIFLTPLTAIVFAILRFAFQTTESIGPTINPARLVVYSTLELSFSIIAACLPSLRLFFKDGSAAAASAGIPKPQRNAQWPERQRHDGAIVLQEIGKTKPRNATDCSTEGILEPHSQTREVVDRISY